MKTLSTEKEIIENTKIITSKDYTHVITHTILLFTYLRK